MGPMTNRVKFQIYFFGLNIDINNFAFDISRAYGANQTNNFASEVKVILGLESTCPDG